MVSDGVAYFADWAGAVHAVTAATGEELWSTSVGGMFVAAPAVTDDSVFVAAGRTLHRLDRETGEPTWQVDTDTHPYAQISASPVVIDDLVVQGTASFENMANLQDYTFRGSIAAYDVESGEEVWRFVTTPDDETAGAGSGIWSTPAVDRKRGLLFVGTGQTLEEPTAPLADAILAIDYETGKLEWARQFTYPDVFSNGHPVGKDADVGASPNLWTSNGRDTGRRRRQGRDVPRGRPRHRRDRVRDTALTPGKLPRGSDRFVRLRGREAGGHVESWATQQNEHPHRQDQGLRPRPCDRRESSGRRS